MAKFKVEVVCERTSRATIEIEASSLDDAEDKAMDLVHSTSDEGIALVEQLRYEGSPFVSFNTTEVSK